ncbi:MAG: type V CRISPR-associated protein Cas12k [Prochloraceae cyanobacterium]
MYLKTNLKQHQGTANLLRKSPVIPFPVSYETNTDLTWSKDRREHLQVRFSGLGKQHQFEIRCDKRQLCWFQRFFEDEKILRRDREQYSSALFTLRSARLLWREGKKDKDNPWEIHTLYLQCSVDTRFWTAEGTKQIASDKFGTVQEILNNLKEKAELTPSQVAYQKRQQSTFTRIKNPFPRPQKPVYQGDPSIIMGVSLGLEKPATIAIVKVTNNRILAYRSIKQLLGKNYKLLNQQQRQKQKLSRLRHQAQKRESNNQFGDSELGKYLDRLIAKAIVEIAQKYRVSSIVLPHLKQIPEITDSELMAKAQKKIPGYKEGQKKYIKQYSCNIHQWSYGRLIESIEQAASKIGIDLETAQQSHQGTPQEQAKELAIFAYNCRLQTVI